MCTWIKLMVRRFLLLTSVLITWSVFALPLARADDWGCQVLLCLTNPGGPEQYSQCVSPIEKLWSALRHGDPFPTCDFASGGSGDLGRSEGGGASNTFASAGYCREDLLHWGGPEQSELLCDATGAINVEINGELYTRVWWDAAAPDRTITEYYGTGSGGVRPEVPYDPTQAAKQFLRAQQRLDDLGGGGGE